MAWHSVACDDLTPQTQVVRSLTAPGKPVLEFYLLFLAVVSSHFVLIPTSWQIRLVYTCTVGFFSFTAIKASPALLHKR